MVMPDGRQTRMMPTRLSYWTADEVAECLSFEKYLTEEQGRDLYRKLWQYLADAKERTPLGGDGSDGTVEDPAGRLDLDNDDKIGHWWERLELFEQDAIISAASSL